MKDLFSANSQLYQQARPSYPSEVVQEILTHVPARGFAWDCGAGSGQFTQLLAPYFDHIVATDMSQQQLQLAPYLDNVSYQVQVAEKTTFPAQGFDLITVAQAIHWFDFEKFYQEVNRTLKPDGVFAVIGYGLIQIENQSVNALVQKLYFEQLNGYWDAERRFIDEEYKTIPFPFEEIPLPAFKMQYQWSAAQLLKYLSTWSAVKHYCEKNPNQNHPLVALAEILTEEHEDLRLEFPIFLRVGKLKPMKNKRFQREYL